MIEDGNGNDGPEGWSLVQAFEEAVGRTLDLAGAFARQTRFSRLLAQFEELVGESPESAFQQLLALMIVLVARLYLRTALVVAHQMRQYDDAWDQARPPGALRPGIAGEWLPRLERQQETLVRLIDEYSKTLKRFRQTDKSTSSGKTGHSQEDADEQGS